MRAITFTKIILRGISQIMLQNNSFTGLLFLIAIFYNSWLMGLGALTGVLASTVAAFGLNYDKNEIHAGLYGFNGALVGIALVFFFGFDITLLCMVILSSILSTLIMNFMHKKNLSPYTFPFVLTTWIFVFLMQQNNYPALYPNIFSSLTMGFGQVMFQASIVTGVIFFIAILFNSAKSAIYAFTGSFVGMAVALAFSFQLNLINLGIFGYNGVLCGIALADKKLFYPVFAIIISVFLAHFHWHKPFNSAICLCDMVDISYKKSAPVISHQLL